MGLYRVVFLLVAIMLILVAQPVRSLPHLGENLSHKFLKRNIKGKKKVIVVCNVTGTQGRAICERFHQLVQKSSTEDIELVGLTRDKDSARAKALAQQYHGLLTLYSVDYRDTSTLKEPFANAHALYMNGAMSKDEAQVYKTILRAALDAREQNGSAMQHIIYSSTSECDRRDHKVPHWEVSFETEQYIHELIAQDKYKDITFHLVRFAHCNENLLSYFKPSKSGWISYPWDPSVKIHTASVRDGARVACRLFLEPALLGNGEKVDIVADYLSPHEMAVEISKVQERQVQACKGPWVLLHVVNHLFYEPWTIVVMGDFIEKHWKEDRITEVDKIRSILKNEIKRGEPLESIQAFCERSFSKFEG